MSLTEACSCGATFTYAIADIHAGSAADAVDAWRRGHQHAESVGICGVVAPTIGPGDYWKPWCSLKADHAGMHGDDDGNHWTTRPSSEASE